MVDAVAATLHVRACVLRAELKAGDAAKVQTAYANLRESMARQYSSGYWKSRPQQLRKFMELLCCCEQLLAGPRPALAATNGADTAFDV